MRHDPALPPAQRAEAYARELRRISNQLEEVLSTPAGADLEVDQECFESLISITVPGYKTEDYVSERIAKTPPFLLWSELLDRVRITEEHLFHLSNRATSVLTDIGVIPLLDRLLVHPVASNRTFAFLTSRMWEANLPDWPAPELLTTVQGAATRVQHQHGLTERSLLWMLDHLSEEPPEVLEAFSVLAHDAEFTDPFTALLAIAEDDVMGGPEDEEVLERVLELARLVSEPRQ